MVPPWESRNFEFIFSNKICDLVEKVAKSSMLEAASNLKQAEGTDLSMANGNGAVVTISVSSGKVLDREVLSRACKSCKMHSSLNK